MFSTRALDKLAEAITNILSQGEGSWREKALELKRELESREVNIEEFISWLTVE